MSRTVTAYPPHLPECYKVAGFRVLGRRKPGVFYIPMDHLAHRELTIGSAEKRDLRIRHRTVSRKHCILTKNVDGQLLLLDAGSKNRVFLAEPGQHSEPRPVAWRIVEVGDHIRLGNVTLVAVDADGRCPLRIWNGPDLVRHAIKLYGSEHLACKYLNISPAAMTAILESEES